LARLIDDIRGSALQKPVWVAGKHEEAWIKHARALIPLLANPELPVLLIDNVSDYYYHGSDQEYWDLKRDFPNLAPPFPFFWAEHRMTTRIHSKAKGDTDMSALVGTKGRIGALVHAVLPDQMDYTGDLPPGTHWVLWCELFIDYGRKGDFPTGPHGGVFFCIDAEGHCLDRPWMKAFSTDDDADAMRSLMTFFHPTLLAVSFLHCKNVEIVENEVPKPLAKKFHARTGRWPVKYKTLIIEPLKQILRHEGKSDSVGVAKAMHICRGHFKDYREGRGLFGKYHQLVWQPSIVRGTRGESAPPREIQVKV
jgi:hypothetical protein